MAPDAPPGTEVRSGLDTAFEAIARPLLNNPANQSAALVLRTIFIILALLFMTLPALNLVTLNLSRILERAPEIGVRKAFGAPKRTLIALFVPGYSRSSADAIVLSSLSAVSSETPGFSRPTAEKPA